MKRRSFLQASLAGLTAMGWAGRKKYRIGVIGHTGRGRLRARARHGVAGL